MSPLISSLFFNKSLLEFCAKRRNISIRSDELWIEMTSLKVRIMAKKIAKPEMVLNNFVAKHMHEVNKSQVFVDRKKDAKRGYSKHKQGRYSEEYRPFLYC